MKYLFFLLLLFNFLLGISQTSTGWLSPSATGDNFNEWTNPTNAYSSDDSRAMVQYDLPYPGDQDYYNYNIPDMTGNTIDSIRVSAEIYSNDSPSTFAILLIKLSGDGGSTWTSIVDTFENTSSYTDQIFYTDKGAWGESWAASELTNANFRVQLTFINGGNNCYQSLLDHNAVNVYYTESSVSSNLAYLKIGGDSTYLKIGGTSYELHITETQIEGDTTGYYFSSEDGNDSYPGTISQPFQTLDTLQALIDADSIGPYYLKRGSEWGEVELYIDQSNVEITSYGSGAKPILKGTKDISGGFSESNDNWTQTETDLPSNPYFSVVWSPTYSATFMQGIPFIFIDGVKHGVAKYPDADLSFYPMATVAGNDKDWFTCTDATWANGYWNGADINFFYYNWTLGKARCTSYSSNTFNMNTSDLTDPGENFSEHDGSSKIMKFYISNHDSAQTINGEWVMDYSGQEIDIYHTGSLNSMTVEVPVSDHVIEIDGVSNVSINNIEIHSGIISSVYVYGCDYVDIDSCNIKYPGFAAILNGNSNYTDVRYDTIRDMCNLGVNSEVSTDLFCDHLVIDNVGIFKGHGGDRNIHYGLGVYDLYPDGGSDLTVQYCKIDSTAMGAICHSPDLDTAMGNTTIYRNLFTNYGYYLTDWGAIYTIRDTLSTNSPIKTIRGNFIGTSLGCKESNLQNFNMTYPIYFDNPTKGFYVDSNSIWDQSQGFFINSAQLNHQIKNNKFVGYNASDNLSWERRAVFFDSEAYEHGPMSNVRFSYNTMVSLDSLDMGMNWDYVSSFDDVDCDIDSNTYHNGFNNSGDMAITFPNGGPRTYNTLSEWRTFTSNTFDMASTYNDNSWVYSDVSGITEDQFVWFFRNYSPSNHVFSLGSATFKDIAGSSVSTSVTVPAYDSKILFYSSGSLSGVDEPFYEE